MQSPHIVVAYDVASNRNRRKVHKALHEYIAHVQKSVFEGDVRDDAILRLTERIGESIDRTSDTVRICRLCARCRCATEIVGAGTFVEAQDDVVL